MTWIKREKISEAQASVSQETSISDEISKSTESSKASSISIQIQSDTSFSSLISSFSDVSGGAHTKLEPQVIMISDNETPIQVDQGTDPAYVHQAPPPPPPVQVPPPSVPVQVPIQVPQKINLFDVQQRPVNDTIWVINKRDNLMPVYMHTPQVNRYTSSYDQKQNIQLDQNAGLCPDPYIIETTNDILKTINNIHGFTNEKISMRTQLEDYRKELVDLLGFDKVFFNTGASETVQQLYEYLKHAPFTFPNQHPLVCELDKKYKPPKKGQKYCALINLVTSQDCIVQDYQIKQAKKEKYKFIVVDATQAVGRFPIPMQKDKVDCLFYSTHKLGSLFSCGIIAMSKAFFNEIYYEHIDVHNRKQYDDIDNEFLAFRKGTFDIPGFVSAYLKTKQFINHIPDEYQMQHTYNSILNSLQLCKDLKIRVLPKPPGTHLFGSILFKAEAPVCVRSIQKYFSDEYIQIGFSTACSTGQDGILRMSWREGLFQDDINTLQQKIPEICGRVFQDTINAQQKQGGRMNAIDYLMLDPKAREKDVKYNMECFNKGMFYLRHHWVPGKLKPGWQLFSAAYQKKYAPMFQEFMLRQKNDISYSIPDFQFRRLSNAVWINSENEQCEQMDLSNFEKDKDGFYKFPLIVSQYYNDKYLMCGHKWNFIKDNELDLEHEYRYRNNPMSEYVLQFTVPIKELLISCANSYKNNREYIVGTSRCSRFRGIGVKNADDPKETYRNGGEDEEEIILGGKKKNLQLYCDTFEVDDIGKNIFVIQPFPYIGEHRKAIELLKQLHKKKAKIIYITSIPGFSPPSDFKEIKERYCSFCSWQCYWLYDDKIKIYTSNIN